MVLASAVGCAKTGSPTSPAHRGALTVLDAPSPVGISLTGLSQRQRSLDWSFDGLSTLHTHIAPAIPRPTGFHDVLAAVNANLPAGTGLRLELRVAPELRGEEWSPWLTIAEWGSTNRFPRPVRTFTLDSGHSGRIDVDYFTAPRPHLYRRAQYRLLATDPSVRVRLVSIALDHERSWTTRQTLRPQPRDIDLNVPFRTQKTPDPALSGRLCSPTSVAMVLAHMGVDHPVATVADLAHDPEFDLFGNWPRNIQAAASLGAHGFLMRVADWSQVGELVDQRIPIIASIQVSPGELHNGPYPSTAGHLIVLTGFDAHGDVRVNDPACGTDAEGRRVYRRADLTNIWLSRTGGTAYILLPVRE